MQINQNISNSCYQQKKSPQKSQTFTSRKAVVRELGDIVRMTRREFPMTSNTQMERHQNLFNSSNWNVMRYTEGLIGEIRGFSAMSETPYMKVLKMMDSIKTLKVGNCSEYAQATYLACKLNGYKDAKIFSLFAYNPETRKIRELDHAVVGVNFQKPISVNVDGSLTTIYRHEDKGIILDSWADYTDFEQNATSRFKNDQVFGRLKEGEFMCYRESALMSGLERDDYLYLKHKYPNLVRKNKFSLKDSLRWLVIDKKQYDFEPIGNNIKETYRVNCDMKAAMSKNELAEFLTRDAHESNVKHAAQKRQEVLDRHNKKKQIQNKLKSFGRKIFK